MPARLHKQEEDTCRSGNNEVYELFQAGWSGALFQQEDTEVAACLVQTDGTIYKRRKNAEKNREKKITQLQAIKQYIIRFAKEKEYQEGRKLWLEPLSKYIYLDEIHKEMNKKLKEKIFPDWLKDIVALPWLRILR